MLEIDEPIDVWVLFKKNIVAPYSFSWHGRQIKIDKINLIHTSRNGYALFYHFSVTAGENFYRLKFDTSKLEWRLEALEEG